ncbi:arsenate reductase (glutaredoxin) [Dokdonella sp.]|uniref:arsenate reductase (glutaredoxin) n=1 Tax=Dokdonella sp. TaxID=2291710 RepID=UPI0025BD6BA3|nr:arsenate reductase (glutaredoxin) [Dokdonella sp.]
MSKIVILHNPRCSKSRAALALLQERGIEPEVVDYLATPPSTHEIERILGKLDLPPRALMRRDEPDYAELNLDDPSLSRAQLVAAMQEHPRLIQRPIVLANGKAAIGRPPENVLSIL